MAQQSTAGTLGHKDVIIKYHEDTITQNDGTLEHCDETIQLMKLHVHSDDTIGDNEGIIGYCDDTRALTCEDSIGHKGGILRHMNDTRVYNGVIIGHSDATIQPAIQYDTLM